MIKRLLGITVLFLFIPAIVLASSSEDAKKELATMNIPFSESSFLMYSQLGNEKVVSLFLDAEIDPNAKNPQGWTALISAAGSNQLNIVKMLVNKGAEVNTRTYQNETALYYAVMSNNNTIIEELMNHGADPTIKSNYGFSALSWAKTMGRTDLITTMQRASSLNNTFQGVILLPPDYPVIKSKTTLKILSDIVIAEAIRDIASIENFKRDENKFGYLLGTKTYNDFAGKFLFGVATGKTDLTYILITPYSAVRYESWKASKQFKPISQKVINDNISRKNLVCIAVAPADAFTTNFWETRFGYAGMKHAASITNVVIRKNIIVYQSLEHEGDKWYFPIDLFTSNEPIEIIAVDNDNEQKIIKVSSDKIASFK